MTAGVHFFPLGNADTIRFDLADGRKILIDFADMRDPNDPNEKRCELSRILKSDLFKIRRDYFDAVCITHIDSDHSKGFGGFFWLGHARKYQEDSRIKIKELWVPAAALLEEGVDGDPRLVRSEARHRFREGSGILVFSRPERLIEYCKQHGIDYEARKHLIVDAGKPVPGYSVTSAEQAEFFVHSPFATRQDKNTVVCRNEDAIVMHVTLREGGRDSRVFLGSDSNYETLGEIVRITKERNNKHRLEWDILKLPHHCSYTAIGPERGTEQTAPTEDTKYLLETCRQNGSVVVSTSDVIPVRGSDADKGTQPPHRQAANYHKRISGDCDGTFEVTMEHPNRSRPKPFGYQITARGIALIAVVATTASVAAASTPRAG